MFLETSPENTARPMPEGEWSDAAVAAFDVLAILKEAKIDMAWNAANQKTSQNVFDRWQALKFRTDAMVTRGEKYSKSMMKRLENDLEKQLRIIDEANVDFDADDHRECFGAPMSDELDDYADIIIKALKSNMRCDEWGHRVEALEFENSL